MKQILIAVLVLFACGLSFAQTGKPSMVIEQAVFDAGVVMKTGAPLEHVFRVKNTGDAPLNILEVKPG